MTAQKEDNNNRVNILTKTRQTNKSNPMFTITCLDALLNPTDNIEILPVHFLNADYAIKWSIEYAIQQGWNSWEVFSEATGVEVYYMNKNLKKARLFGREMGF
jgi:hypothetical protein